jgi:hypothetical protein
MSPAQLFELLAERRVVVTRRDGGPYLDGPTGTLTPDLVDECRRHRWLFLWGLEGRGSGHVWHACDACQEVQLVAQQSRPRRCALTPACGGHLRPLPDIFTFGSSTFGATA